MPAERHQRAVLYGRCWRTGLGKTELRQLRDDARNSDLGVLGELSLSFGDRGDDVRFGQVFAGDRFSGFWTVPGADGGLSSIEIYQILCDEARLLGGEHDPDHLVLISPGA